MRISYWSSDVCSSDLDETRRAGAADQDEPQIRSRQDREKPRQQEDTGLHPRRRMQIRADRRWRGHGVGQPEMERELRRFRDGRTEARRVGQEGVRKGRYEWYRNHKTTKHIVNQ